MRFRAILVNREHRYALEREARTDLPAFSIPVRNAVAEYDEYYRLSEPEFAELMSDPRAALTFATRCGRREMDDRLIVPPGTDRGHW